ncbi:FMN-binding protein [Dehalococcoidia bacterium]|nr:FMN-binding protein [Dehalococcoidia bacterium]MCL0065309.1 FMN-binding protein [Dehalococcoidia bacterium]MCL0076211.1 FMN-binding protein [Dehalococcoidia bacterium]
MNKGLRISGIILLVLIVLVVAVFFYIKLQEVPHVEVTNIELSEIQDGIYEGSFSEGPVSVRVSVEVKENKIIEIIIIEHQTGLGKKAEKIIGDVIREQSLEVDAISGATLSSNVIRRAIQEALNK